MNDRSEDHEEIESDGHLLLEDDASVSSLEKIYEVFAASARRWEAIVYPSLFAFIILAVYGFYLIFSLTSDVDRVVNEMKTISGSMISISKDINDMSSNVDGMLTAVKSMDSEIAMQLVEMQQLNKNFSEMNQSVHVMTAAVNQMRHDMAMMNQNVSRPMNFMNSFMPW